MPLKDWFDPRRIKDDYVPIAFRGYEVQTRAVRGHEFGLQLNDEERKELIAFLRTL
jgi:Zn-dependent membrane protease YugP